MLERLFKVSENNTSVRTETLAGVKTFLTMAYIIFAQPAVLFGKMFGADTGIDFGAVTTAACLSAALGTAIMILFLCEADWLDATKAVVQTACAPAQASSGSGESGREGAGLAFVDPR